MKAIVMVYDNRTFNGYNTRSKDFDTVSEACKWAKQIKNRIFNTVTIIDCGFAYKINI